MKLYNLLSSTTLIILLLSFLVIPQKIFAVDFNFFNFSGEDSYQILSEFESRKILENFPDILYNKWTALKIDGYSDPKEETALCLLKHISTLDMFNYFFRDLPLDVSFNITKESLDMIRLIGTEDASGMIGKIEKGTVDVAVNYLKDYFFKNQIKVSFGAMEMKYRTEFGNIDNPLQYIIMYKRIDDSRSMIVARVYSSKNFIPPTSRGSIGLTSGFANSLNYGESLPPFIIEINGIMKDGLFGSYYWEDKNTAIKTIFPETVPDFGLKPRTWQEKYIINPIKNTINSFSGILSFFNGSTNDLTEYIFKDITNEEAINKEIKSISSGDSLEEDYPVKEEKKELIDNEVINNDDKVVIKEEKKEIKKQEEKQEEKKEDNKIICSKLSQNVSMYDVVINEIAWMGTENNANDEWIELKNVSSADINLRGWTLRDKEDQINIVFEDLIVPVNGFLLLERTNDDSVPFKQADLTYKGSLSNSEEELYLFDDKCILRDFVSGNPKWSAGDSSTKKTMERNNDLNGWHTYSGVKNNNIWGTPKENNSNVGQETAIVASSSSGSSTTIISGGGIIPEVTYCSQVNLPSPDISKVIVNEIAWMGTENSANDEWIELKNISDEPVDLSNWQLLDAEDIKITFNASTIINPQEFYLLERTDNDAVPNIQMSREYTGGLSNNNESLRLFNSDCQLMDEVLALPNWLAGDSELRKTMERDVDLNGWHTYSSESADNLSGLWGTPKAENSIEVINEDQEEIPEEEQLNDNSNHLLITEIQTGEIGETEYVEIYNQTDNPIELCPNEENCYYLSYYSPASEWYDPYRNWKFPIGSVIGSNSYYIIDIFGDSGDPAIGSVADWKVKSMEDKYYELGQIGNSAGSFSLFSNNPKYIKVEAEEDEELIEPTNEEKIAQAITLKIDAVSWKSDDIILPIVKEGESFLLPGNDESEKRVIGRKWSNGKYRDTENNLNDFQSEIPSLRNHVPRVPEKIQDLITLIDENQKNSVILSWTAPFDEDTVAEDLDYEIYYSRNNQIDDDSLVNIKEYNNIEIVSEENNKRSVIVKDVFYDSKYYFKIVAKDPEKNISPLSEEVSFVIDEANHQKRSPYYDFKRSGHSQLNGSIGSSFTADILIEGNQDFPFNNNFASNSVIDENGTIYFGGSNNKSYDFYAYSSSQKKWSIHCSEACGFYPSLGKDGTIYFSSEHSIYAFSPSGKIIWQKDYTRVFTKSIIIDSEENIYYLATKTSGPILISIDKNGLEAELYNTQEILKGADPVSFTELVIDDSNNIYFAINDFLVKYNGGAVTMQQFFPKYEKTYSGPIDIMATINRVNISFSGIVLLNLTNGRKVSVGEQYPVLYAVDNNLSKILWFKDDYNGPMGLNEEEFYYSKILAGSYPMVFYLGAADIVTGNTKWERTININIMDVNNLVVSDSLNRIYFIKTLGGIFGYDSNNMPEKLDDKLFYISPGKYYNEVISIGNNKIIFSDTQRVYKIDISQ